MQKSKNEEIYYCTHCGAANKKSAVECTECEKKTVSKYRPFYDFLKKHTKEKGTSTAVDTVLGIIYRFLASHIYGIVLTVSIVAASVVAVQGMDTHIKEVREPQTAQTYATQPDIGSQEPKAEESNVTEPEEQEPLEEEQVERELEQETVDLTEYDIQSFEHLMCNLDAFADELRASPEYTCHEIVYYTDPGELYAENNIAGFNYGGVHDMISNPIDFYMVDEDPNINIDDYDARHVYENRCCLPETAVTGEACTTQIAKRLYNDGYNVAECNYMLNSGIGDYDFDTLTGGTDLRRVVYKFVFVENNGEWYIVEDRLLENYSV